MPFTVCVNDVRTCNKHGENKKAYTVLDRKPQGTRPFQRLGVWEHHYKWLFHVRCNSAGASNQLRKGSHDKTFVNMVINLLDSIEQEMSLPNETYKLFKEDFIQCHYKIYIIFLVNTHFIAQINDLVIMNLTEAANLSHTDRC